MIWGIEIMKMAIPFGGFAPINKIKELCFHGLIFAFRVYKNVSYVKLPLQEKLISSISITNLICEEHL